MKSEPGPPATLGSSARAGVRLVEPDPAELAERYGADMTLPVWRERLVCSRCGGRVIDMVVTGTKQ